MNRRTFIAATGTAATTMLAGCSNDSDSDSDPDDNSTPNDDGNMNDDGNNTNDDGNADGNDTDDGNGDDSIGPGNPIEDTYPINVDAGDLLLDVSSLEGDWEFDFGPSTSTDDNTIINVDYSVQNGFQRVTNSEGVTLHQTVDVAKNVEDAEAAYDEVHSMIAGQENAPNSHITEPDLGDEAIAASNQNPDDETDFSTHLFARFSNVVINLRYTPGNPDTTPEELVNNVVEIGQNISNNEYL